MPCAAQKRFCGNDSAILQFLAAGSTNFKSGETPEEPVMIPIHEKYMSFRLGAFAAGVLVVLCLLSATGCRGSRRDDAYMEMLDAEKRWLESQLYDADYDLDLLEEQLESTRRENDLLRAEISGKSSSGGAFEGGGNSNPDGEPGQGGLRPPDIEIPGGANSTNGPELAPQTARKIDQRVTRIVLNPLLTGGYNLDNEPGDDGLSIVIEPRNAIGEYVKRAAPVRIALLDPRLKGAEARVAQWEFDQSEAGEKLRTTSMGKGIHLRLPWPNRPPKNSRLKLFVRYVAPDGKQLEADREVYIELNGQVSARWTPASSERLAARQQSTADDAPVARVATALPNAAGNQSPVKPDSAPAAGEAELVRPRWRPYR